MLSKLTLIGIHNYSKGAIWDDIRLPDGYDKEILVNEILKQCGEFCVIYPDQDFLKVQIEQFFKKWYHNFDRWMKANNFDYEALYNLDVKATRTEEGENYEVGQVITVADFEEGKKIDVTATSKGKGTQGNIKRHGHHRGPMSHGSKHKRLPGALAAGTYPSRVFKGNAGPGRMGRETVTVQNLVLVKVIEERNLMLVKGAVPGNKGGLVRVQYAVKGDK